MNSSKSQKKPVVGYGGWEFARDFSAGIFGLLNTGRIFPAFGLLLLVIFGLIVWRLPDTDLAFVIGDFFDVLRSSTALAFGLFASSNVVWLVLFRKQKRIYENEINRLSDIRRDLFHLGNDQVLIEKHRTSNGSHVESYILPDSNDGKSKDMK